MRIGKNRAVCKKVNNFCTTTLFAKPEEVSFEHLSHGKPLPPPPPTESREVPFPLALQNDGFDKAFSMKVARGDYGSGDTCVWMKLNQAVVDGEDITPLERALIVADTANGISAFLDIEKFTFINTDLTLYLGCLPESEFIAVDARSHVQANGLGFTQAWLFDEVGLIGQVNQSLLVRKR